MGMVTWCKEWRDFRIVALCTFGLNSPVIGSLSIRVEDVVSGDHVIDDRCLRDFLGTELSLLGEILAVVVAEMVVRNDGL